MLTIKSLGMMALLLLLTALQSPATAGDPTDQLSGTINKFLGILTSTPVSELRANGLPDSARKLVVARFDFSEMAKRSLAAHWKALNQGEQKEFVDAFTERLL